MIDKLEMFIAVAKERHFGRAAISIGSTQPSLSAGIKQLEDQLGVQLIFRGSCYGSLTLKGQATLVWARRIVGDGRQLREEMRAFPRATPSAGRNWRMNIFACSPQTCRTAGSSTATLLPSM